MCYPGISKLKDTEHTVLVLLSDFTLFVQESEINGADINPEIEKAKSWLLFPNSLCKERSWKFMSKAPGKVSTDHPPQPIQYSKDLTMAQTNCIWVMRCHKESKLQCMRSSGWAIKEARSPSALHCSG